MSDIIKDGDIVRLTIEGPWRGLGPVRYDGDVVIPDYDGQIAAAKGDKVTIELVESATIQPTFEPGDLVKDDDGTVYLLLENGGHANVQRGRVCACGASFETMAGWGLKKIEVAL